MDDSHKTLFGPKWSLNSFQSRDDQRFFGFTVLGRGQRSSQQQQTGRRFGLTTSCVNDGPEAFPSQLTSTRHLKWILEFGQVEVQPGCCALDELHRFELHTQAHRVRRELQKSQYKMTRAWTRTCTRCSGSICSWSVQSEPRTLSPE